MEISECVLAFVCAVRINTMVMPSVNTTKIICYYELPETDSNERDSNVRTHFAVVPIWTKGVTTTALIRRFYSVSKNLA